MKEGGKELGLCSVYDVICNPPVRLASASITTVSLKQGTGIGIINGEISAPGVAELMNANAFNFNGS
jgi:hypothetical protein